MTTMRRFFNPGSAKNSLRRFLLSLAQVRRVHIIGCSRSGTTMLHYSMIAFKNTILHDQEVSVWGQPTVTDCLLMLKDNFFKNERSFFITKRSAGWLMPEALDKTLRYVKANNVFVINIVRDPRDVLLSKHPYSGKEYYVEPLFWEKSIQAADFLMGNLPDDQKMTVKYEDIILRPSEIQSLLSAKVGLELKPNISWARLERNIELLCGPERTLPYGRMVPLKHKLRDFNAGSIGKWKGSNKAGYISGLLSDPQHGSSLSRFLESYNYQT